MCAIYQFQKASNITNYLNMLVCLGLTSLLNTLGHIAKVLTCSSGNLTKCAATLECHAMDTGHDTPPRHSTVFTIHVFFSWLNQYLVTLIFKIIGDS